MAVAAGIDGCPAGWLCVTRNLATGCSGAQILARIEDVLSLDPRPDVVALDIPIGLPEAGPRACDREARARLGAPRCCSVFPAPLRPVLAASTYGQGCQLRQAVDGKKMSRQAWAILPKIRAVDSFLRADRTRQGWIREVHPEVCFWCWNDGRAMAQRKKSAAGRAAREGLVLPKYGPVYRDAQVRLPRGAYGNDDLLDAFAALWTAERILAGAALTLPAAPPVDSCGLRMEIVV